MAVTRLKRKSLRNKLRAARRQTRLKQLLERPVLKQAQE